jgi:hypothetical protein
MGDVKNNSQLVTGVLKVGGGRRESLEDHTTMTEGDNERCEHAADVEGSNEEGEGSKGDAE